VHHETTRGSNVPHTWRQYTKVRSLNEAAHIVRETVCIPKEGQGVSSIRTSVVRLDSRHREHRRPITTKFSAWEVTSPLSEHHGDALLSTQHEATLWVPGAEVPQRPPGELGGGLLSRDLTSSKLTNEVSFKTFITVVKWPRKLNP